MSLYDDIFGGGGKSKINSKRKGDRNEREVAKLLTKWTGQKFIRTPSSGGIATRLGSMSVNAAFCGDVSCVDQNFEFHFTVETKHYKSLALSKELRSNSKVYSIYQQAKRDAEAAGRLPMIMLRKNGMAAGEYMIYFDVPVESMVIDSLGHGLYGYYSDNLIQLDFQTFQKSMVEYAKANSNT